MFQKLEAEQLQGLSYDDLVAHKAEAEAFKAKLEAAKAKGGKGWTDTAQEKLDDVVMYLVDLDEVIEAKKPAEPKPVQETKAEIPAGCEKTVILELVRGRRFNPMTGAEESTPYRQMFSFAEWQNFKKHYKGLGYTVVSVVNDPFGDAAELVAPKKKEA